MAPIGAWDATTAAQYVVTHPQTSHNPINFDFLLDSLSKSDFFSFISFILKPTEVFYDAKNYNAGS
jgi:hypothetical protein